jgi:hypothetical protein
MDYYFVGNGHSNKGLVDIYLKTKIKLTKKSLLLLYDHNFSAAADITDPTDATKNMSNGLGQEIDLVYVYNASKTVNFKLGYSQYFKTDSIDELKGLTGTNSANYNSGAWIMLTFKPTLFKK